MERPSRKPKQACISFCGRVYCPLSLGVKAGFLTSRLNLCYSRQQISVKPTGFQGNVATRLFLSS